MGIREDVFCDNFLQQLSATLQEADGMVHFGKTVVWFVEFGEYHYGCLIPQMVA